jgi:predicted RNA-binding Zn ribbon-like protein
VTIPGPIRPAPGSLDRIRLFLNTTDLEDGGDELDTPSAARKWLADHGLLRRSARLDENDLIRLVALREGLRSLAYANNGAPLDDHALERLNALAAGAPLAPAFSGGERFRLSGDARDVTGAMATLLAVVCEAMCEGTWSRLKACRNDRCRWAFYDASRNRVGYWCSMDTCGNRAKVRAYRQRHKRVR